MNILRTDKPKLGENKISDPVCAITEDGIIVTAFWDGEMWHEISPEGKEETYGQGIADWHYLPKNWGYDSEFYS